MMKVRNQPKLRRVITQLAIQRCNNFVRTSQDTLWRRSRTTFTTYSCRFRGTLSQPSEQCCHNVIDDVAYYLSTTFGQLLFSFHGIEFVQLCAKLKVARHFSGYISHKITFKKNVLGFIFGPIFFKLLTFKHKIFKISFHYFQIFIVNCFKEFMI
jgi:hypothetical protein